MMNPYYNLEGLGIHFVASPRNANMLLVSRRREVALQRTFAATADLKLVRAVGDCGCGGGLFCSPADFDGENYAIRGHVANVIPIDVAVRCPPTPSQIMQGILTAISPRKRAASGK